MGPGAERAGHQHPDHEIAMQNRKVSSSQSFQRLRRGQKAEEKWVFCPLVAYSSIF